MPGVPNRPASFINADGIVLSRLPSSSIIKPLKPNFYPSRLLITALFIPPHNVSARLS